MSSKFKYLFLYSCIITLQYKHDISVPPTTPNIYRQSLFLSQISWFYNWLQPNLLFSFFPFSQKTFLSSINLKQLGWMINLRILFSFYTIHIDYWQCHNVAKMEKWLEQSMFIVEDISYCFCLPYRNHMLITNVILTL